MTQPQPPTGVASLFKLYETDNLPTDSGFIVTSSYDDKGSIYSVLEIISYANVKEINSDGNSLTFRSDGYKIYLLIEPANYYQRQTEPVFREAGKSAPYRFSEMEIFSDYRNNRVMVGKNPIVSLSSFTIESPDGDNFSIFIHRDKKIRETMKTFLIQVLNKDLGIPTDVARQAANFAVEIIVHFVKL